MRAHHLFRSLGRGHASVGVLAVFVTALAGAVVLTPPTSASAAEATSTLTVDGSCTWTQALDAIAYSRSTDITVGVQCGNDVVFGDDATTYTLTLGTDVGLTTTTKIGFALIVEGEGHMISRSGEALFRLFTVTASGDLTIKDAVLSGGRVVGADGADGPAEPSELCYTDGDCAADAGEGGAAADGGAIAVTGGTLNLERVVLTDNSVVGGDGGRGGHGLAGRSGDSFDVDGYIGGVGGHGGNGGPARGGAVYSAGGTVTISDSLFTGNTATAGDGGDGGAGGHGGDGADGGAPSCEEDEAGVDGHDGGNGGNGGDGGNAGGGGDAFGAAVYARGGDVLIRRTSIEEQVATGGDSGQGGGRGEIGQGGADNSDETITCTPDIDPGDGGFGGADDPTGNGGGPGVSGTDRGTAGHDSIASNALGAAIFFDGYTDNDLLGNSRGTFSLEDSTVTETVAAPGHGDGNYIASDGWDCQDYSGLDRKDALCDAVHFDRGVGTAVAGDGALSVVSSTIAGNTTKLSLATSEFDDQWQLNAGLLQAWVSDTDASLSGENTPEWHSKAWLEEDLVTYVWKPTIPVTVTSSIIGPNYVRTTDDVDHLPNGCRQMIDQTGGETGKYVGWDTRNMSVRSGGHNVFYGQNATYGDACVSATGSDHAVSTGAIDLDDYESLLAAYTLPGAYAPSGYLPFGVARGNGSVCTDGDDPGLDQAGQEKDAAACDIGAVQLSTQMITVYGSVGGERTYGDEPGTYRITDAKGLPAAIDVSGITAECDLADDVDDTADLDAGHYAIDVGSCVLSGSLTGPEAYRYTVKVNKSAGLTVDKAPLHVTASDAATRYSDDAPEITAAYETGDLRNGDTLDALRDADELSDPTCSTTYTEGDDAGTYPSTCANGDAANYEFVYVDGTVTIDPQAATLTVNGVMPYHGEPTFSWSASPYGVHVAPRSVTCTKATTGTLLTRLHVMRTAPYGYEIDGDSCTGPDVDSSGNYTISKIIGGTFTVTTQHLTVTPQVAPVEYGSDAKITYSVTGYVNDEDSDVLQGTITCATDYEAGDDAGDYTATCQGATAQDYTVGYPDVTFTVAPAPVTAYVSGHQTYGSTPTFSISGVPEGVVYPADADPTCSDVTADGGTAIDPTLSAGTYTLAADGCSGAATDASGNHAFVLIPRGFTVTPKQLTVAPKPVTVTYGSAAPDVLPSIEGFANGEDASDLTTAPSCSATYTRGDGVGVYTTTCTGLQSDDYTVSYGVGRLTVAPAALTVTAPEVDLTFGDAVPALPPVYEGFVAGDTVATLVATGALTDPVCTTGYTQGDDVGEYAVTCSGGAADDYTLVAGHPGSITVAAAPVSITVSASQRYGDAASFSHSPLPSGVELPAPVTCDAVADGTPVSTALSAGDYTLVSCHGPTTDSSGNHALTYVGGVLFVSPRTLVITASDTIAVYGADAPAVHPVYVGFAEEEDAGDLAAAPVCATTDYAAGNDIGSYANACTGAASPNYDVVYAPGTLTVTPATLRATTAAATTQFAHSLPDLPVDYSGFTAGDDANVLTHEVVCAAWDNGRPVTPLTLPGKYPIVCTAGAAKNYTIEYATGEDAASLTVAPPSWFSFLLSATNVEAGGSLRISGGTLPAGTVLRAWLHSEPVDLGAVPLAADGTFSALVTIPANTPAGTHDVVVEAVLPDGTVLSSSTPVTVRAAASSPVASVLPVTGGTPGLGAALLTALLALAAGAASLAVARVRRYRRARR